MIIVVPLDFSENSLKALEFAMTIAAKRDARIILVHVVNLSYDFAAQSANALESLLKEGEALLQTTIEKYRAPGVQVDYQILEGDPAINIARVAAEKEARMILIGTQGASGIAKKLIGSTTVNLIREARCPVLIVPAQAKIELIKKATLAMEFSDHEEAFIDWIVDMTRRWELGLEILHVQSGADFKEQLAVLGLEGYLQKKYPGIMVRIHTFYASSASQGLELYMDEHDNMILVMCHQHRNLWEQILQKSLSVQMAFHTHIPLLIMN